jgi:hypothetical protein
VQGPIHTWKLAFLGALVALAVLAQPAGAASGPGTTCQAPPGTSAIDQYCEALPTPGGTSGHHRAHSHPVSNSTTKQLEQQGAAGKAVLNLANSSGDAGSTPPAPPVAVHKKAIRHHKRKAASSSPTPPAVTKVKPASNALPAPASNPLSAVGSAIGTGSSTGALLLWLLVALAVVMGGTALIGYRRRARES